MTTPTPATKAPGESICVRALGVADAAALLAGETIDGFVLRHVSRRAALVPTTFAIEPHAAISEVYPINERGRPDKNEAPLGQALRYTSTSINGGSGGGRLGTTDAAQAALVADRASEDDTTALSAYRRSINVMADPDGQAFPLAPVFGTQVNVSAIIAGLDPFEVRSRIESAIAAEFADTAVRGLRVKTRQSLADYVNVYEETFDPDAEGLRSRRLIAVNVLSDEVFTIMGEREGSISTEAAEPGLYVGG